MGLKGKTQKRTLVRVKPSNKRMVVREGGSTLSSEQLLRSMNRLLLRVFPMIGDPALKGDIHSILLRFAEYEAVSDLRDEEAVRKENRSAANSKNSRSKAAAMPKGMTAEQDDLLTGRYAKKLAKRGSCGRCGTIRSLWLPHDDVATQYGLPAKTEVCGLCLFQRVTVNP